MCWTHWAISRSSQCSMTGVTKAVVGLIRQPIAPWANALTMELHFAPYRSQFLKCWWARLTCCLSSCRLLNSSVSWKVCVWAESMMSSALCSISSLIFGLYSELSCHVENFHLQTKKRKECNVLFNDTLITFFILWLYSVGLMSKDHSDSERGEEGRKCFI